MSSSQDNKNCKTEQISWEQRLLTNRPLSKLPLNPDYVELKFTLHRKLVGRINLEALAAIDNQRVRSEVRQALISLIDSEPTLLSSLEKQQICDEVLDEVFGLGPLEPLLQDPTISDILVNTHKQVYIERKGLSELTRVSFQDSQHLVRIIDKIVSQVGRRVDESSPMVDARLSDGSRVTAILPPLAVDGPLLSIRRRRSEMLVPSDLLELNSLTQEMMTFLEAVVKARLNIIVSGGAGAGKTTLLNTLCSFIPPKERIVTIEETVQLQLKQPFVVRLQARLGHSAIGQNELLANSSQIQPDRIVVGELDGPEVFKLLQTVKIGARSFLTTIQANSPREAIDRLELLIGAANSNILVSSIRELMSSAVNILVQVDRFNDGTHRVTQISDVVGLKGEKVMLRDVFMFERTEVEEGGRVRGNFHLGAMTSKLFNRVKTSGVALPSHLFDLAAIASRSSRLDIGRLIPVVAHVLTVFLDEHKAVRWFSSPHPHLDNRSPLEVLSEDDGITRVEQLLSHIEDSATSE
jgi:pilus assembly protein CpaF